MIDIKIRGFSLLSFMGFQDNPDEILYEIEHEIANKNGVKFSFHDLNKCYASLKSL